MISHSPVSYMGNIRHTEVAKTAPKDYKNALLIMWLMVTGASADICVSKYARTAHDPSVAVATMVGPVQ